MDAHDRGLNMSLYCDDAKAGQGRVAFPLRLSRFLAFVCEKISMFFIVAMLLIVWAQIFFRYFNIGLLWAEEVCRYIMVWLGMIGASILVVEEGHIKITFIYDRLNRRTQLLLNIGFNAMTAYTVGLFVYYGWAYAKSGLRIMTASLPITRFIPNLAIPVGSLLILINLFVLIYRDLRSLMTHDAENTIRRTI